MAYNNDSVIPAYDQRDAQILGSQPYDLLDQFQDISRDGFYGKSGIDDLTRDATRNAFRRTKMIEQAMQRSKFSRGLGGRAAAGQRELFGSIYGQAVGQIGDQRLGLQTRNLESRSGVGLNGQMGVMSFLQDRFNTNRQLELEEGQQDRGLLGTIGDLVSIGTNIYGAFNPAEQLTKTA